MNVTRKDFAEFCKWAKKNFGKDIILDMEADEELLAENIKAFFLKVRGIDVASLEGIPNGDNIKCNSSDEPSFGTEGQSNN